MGLFENSLLPAKILTTIRFPKPGRGAGGAYMKVERKIGDYAVAAVAVQLTLTANRDSSAIRIGLTNVSSVPMRASRREAALLGKPPSEAALTAAAKAASEECDPSTCAAASIQARCARRLKRTVRKAPRARRRCPVMKMKHSVTVNGELYTREVEPRMLLVHLTARASSGSPARTSAAIRRAAAHAR